MSLLNRDITNALSLEGMDEKDTILTSEPGEWGTRGWRFPSGTSAIRSDISEPLEINLIAGGEKQIRLQIPAGRLH